MKKILNILAICSLSLCATSCYDDVVMDYDFSAAYFAQPQPLRTVLWGRTGEAEANEISVGAAIGGKRQVDLNDWARFIEGEDAVPTIEAEMGMTFSDMGLEVMPSSYYEFSDPEKMVVTKVDNFIVDVDVSFTEEFFNDPKAVDSHYAIPIVLVDSSCDTLLSTKYYSVVAVKYQSKYHGTYYVQGYTAQRDGGSYTDITSYNNPDLSQNLTSSTTSVAYNSIERVGQTLSVGTTQLENGNVKITVPDDATSCVDDDGLTWYDVEVTAAEGDQSFVTGTGLGKMFYDESTHDCIFKISYLATYEGVYFEVSETLTRRQDPLYDLRVEFWVAPEV